MAQERQAIYYYGPTRYCSLSFQPYCSSLKKCQNLRYLDVRQALVPRHIPGLQVETRPATEDPDDQ